MADEKFYTIPLGDAFDYVRTKRVRRAVTMVRAFVSRHSKVDGEQVRLSEALNMALWRNGIQKPPRRIRIKVVKEGEFARAYLPEETVKKPEPKKEEAKEKAEVKSEEKKSEAKKEEKKAEAKAEKAGTTTKADANVKREAPRQIGKQEPVKSEVR
ncbi:MAG: 50S ribosomal protein L31e [Candidatus ainarchaeum sp.]|nr:50S ribosomal protein L31e [Candidatus ainarchaeum sp.]